MKHMPAIFIADAPALDFLNSVATPVDARVDWLDDGEGLLSWLEQSRLVDASALEQVRSQSSSRELNRVAEQARNLREWFRRFVRDHQGRPLSRQDLKKLEPLNRLLVQDASFSQIGPTTVEDGGPFELRSARKWRSPETLLLPIAEALARFVCSADFRYIKACQGPRCTLLFADQTRSRARRWCSMAICGNRAKQAAHRRRIRATR